MNPEMTKRYEHITLAFMCVQMFFIYFIYAIDHEDRPRLDKAIKSPLLWWPVLVVHIGWLLFSIRIGQASTFPPGFLGVALALFNLHLIKINRKK